MSHICCTRDAGGFDRPGVDCGPVGSTGHAVGQSGFAGVFDELASRFHREPSSSPSVGGLAFQARFDLSISGRIAGEKPSTIITLAATYCFHTGYARNR